MHRILLKTLNKEYPNPLYKSEDSHPIKNSKPHLIFSVENPRYESKNKISHEDIVNSLKSKGYKVHDSMGHYGAPEKSILVETPKPYAVKSLMDFARKNGQESVIYSDGSNHELHYLNGPNDRQHHKGRGTSIHSKTPEGDYTQMPDGIAFSHSFDFDNLHSSDTSMLRRHMAEDLKKSETIETGKFYIPEMRKSEHSGKEMNLIHYSPEQGLKTISPKFHGARRIGSEVKRGIPENKLAFFYREGTAPETVVASGSKSKYVAKITPDHRLYDLGEDSLGVRQTLQEKADKKEINTGIYNNDDIHKELKDRGYHGFFNTKSTLPDVVAMFGEVPVDREHHLHPNDFKTVSAENHHEKEKSLESAKQFAKETGHEDPKFLANLSNHFKK